MTAPEEIKKAQPAPAVVPPNSDDKQPPPVCSSGVLAQLNWVLCKTAVKVSARSRILSENLTGKGSTWLSAGFRSFLTD